MSVSTSNWLGLSARCSQPSCKIVVTLDGQSTLLGTLLKPHADGVAEEKTDVSLRLEADGLRLKAVCYSHAMGRVRELAARTEPPARDAWGDDSIEVQIDVGRVARRYRHFIVTPSGHVVTFIAGNNLQEQGWHPKFEAQVSLSEGSWTVEAFFSFDVLGCTGVSVGDVWGFNFMRVNRSEKTGYVQWSPTYGDALRPEFFGELRFAGEPADRAGEVASYISAAAERVEYFKRTINRVSAADALRELNMSDWSDWAAHIAQRQTPMPLRWEGYVVGAAGVPERDRAMAMQMADTLVEQIAEWVQEPPDKRAFGLEPLEALGDAYLLTGDQKYVAAFERAMAIHDRRVEEITLTITGPDQLHYSTNPYYDAQIVRLEMLSYVYLSMRSAGLSELTHKCMMRALLRGCRFAAYNIGRYYCYGNHQIYESGGLVAVSALYPEFRESDVWAQTASRAIAYHLEREVYADGGYNERCGYHSVAMSYAMHGVATVKVNNAESRFIELMGTKTQATLEKMHEWISLIAAPDGTMPAYGDYGAYTQHRFLARGAAIFNRPDFAWHLKNHTPDLIPQGITPEPPNKLSVSLDSHFTVLRDGWSTTDFYLALDHGPMGGQHSHVDTLGFVAYAHGVPIALDAGIGTSYEDPRYLKWFRSLRAHNVIAIDDVEPEKVAHQTFWKPGKEIDVVGMQSHAYKHSLGIIHDRVVHFIKGAGWVIEDRLHFEPGHEGKVDGKFERSLEKRKIDWHFHTPMDLKAESAGVLSGVAGEVGLLVMSADAGLMETPTLEKHPASVPVRDSQGMRLWDMVRQKNSNITTPISALTWRLKPVQAESCQIMTALIPYRGARPKVEFKKADSAGATGMRLCIDGRVIEV